MSLNEDTIIAISSKFMEDISAEGAITISMIIPMINGEPQKVITASNMNGSAGQRAECLRILAKYIDEADRNNTIQEVPTMRTM